jgi:hypothetical protein
MTEIGIAATVIYALAPRSTAGHLLAWIRPQTESQRDQLDTYSRLLAFGFMHAR